MTAATSSPASSASEQMARLRLRLTLVLGLLVAGGLVILAATASLVDSQLRNDRFGEEQQGLASRAAALVFIDDELGDWNVDGVVDDMVSQETDVLSIIERGTQRVLLQQGGEHDPDDLARLAFNDAAEVGVVGTMIVKDREFVAAAAPFFDGDDVVGAVVVASMPGPDSDQRRLLVFVWSTAATLTALSLAASWWIAGRALRPMGEAVDREGRFLAAAAHELRTPVARAQAVAESTVLTARQLPPSDERTTLLAELRRLVALTRHTSSDVNDLLLVGRIDAAQLQQRVETIRLDQLLADFETSVPELAVATSGRVELRADPVLVRHAFANLFTNAQRHSGLPANELVIHVTVDSADGGARVVVADNGRGFGDPGIDQIFDRHASSAHGSGLGLWLVRHIVEASSGAIVASENDPHGAVFTIVWPSI